ncbi:MAG TPA: hypothetical protein PKL84_12790, partial [Candidatus Hydrogenedentes bacterium]|nr:hypothetical protein [Candidatus Hydrogenedentota bacterium]
MKRNGATITETRSEVYLVRSRGPRRHTSRPILAAAVAVFAMGIAVAPGYATEGAYLTGLDALHLQRAGGGAASPRSAAWM